MALSTTQKIYNESILFDLIERNFAAVANREQLLNAVIAAFEERDVCLFTYSGAYHNIITNGLKTTIKNNRFEPALLPAAIAQTKQDFHARDAELRAAHKAQLPENSAVDELEAGDSVESQRLLTHKDINRFLDHYLAGQKHILHSTSMSLTEDNGAAVQDFLKRNQTFPGKLLLPVNIDRNHWGLIIRTQDAQNKVSVTYWDSMAGSPENERRIKAIIQPAVEAVHGKAANVTCQFTAQQKDGLSCGQRVVQKTLQEAGIKNVYTQVPTNDGGRMCVEFVKDLAAITPATLPRQKVTSTAMEQETTDGYLAILLQDVYLKNIDNPSLSNDDAMNMAKQRLTKTNYRELEDTKKEVVQLLNSRHSFYTTKPSRSAKSCASELLEDDSNPFRPIKVGTC